MSKALKVNVYVHECIIVIFIYIFSRTASLYEGLDGGSWYSLIITNLAIYSLSLKFWLIH